jgi:hypothetical protein
MLRSAPSVICDKAALVVRDIRFVFVTGYADHGLPAYRDRPTLRLKRTLQERLGTCQSLAPFRVWGPDRGRIAAIESGETKIAAAYLRGGKGGRQHKP